MELSAKATEPTVTFVVVSARILTDSSPNRKKTNKKTKTERFHPLNSAVQQINIAPKRSNTDNGACAELRGGKNRQKKEREKR